MDVSKVKWHGKVQPMASKESVTMRIALAALVSFLLFGTPWAAGGPGEGPNDRKTQDLVMAGGKLTAQEAAALETRLEGKPDDLDARVELLGYYVRHQTSEAERSARQKHALWLIQNHPESSIAGRPWALLNRHLDGAAYDQASALWLRQVEANGQNSVVIENAANFFWLGAPDKAEDLLKKGQLLEPDNPHWTWRLGELHALGMRSKQGQDRVQMAARSLAELEKAFAGMKDADDKFDSLGELAGMAFEAGQLDKSGRYANDLLKMAQGREKNWNYGNAIHDGNVVLGRIALRSGNVTKANEYLLQAGKTPGSPQLNSFGPNFILAKELVEKGEKQSVIEYLRLCETFWKGNTQLLQQWIAEIEQGHHPDFKPVS
jgi:hypothetical protein